MHYSLSGISAPSLDDADSPEVDEFVMPLDEKHQGAKPNTYWPLTYVYTLDSIEIVRIDGLFVPTTCRKVAKTTYSNGKSREVVFDHERLEIDLDPDFEALKAFVPDIPEGTQVYFTTEEQAVGLYKWSNGRVVPARKPTPTPRRRPIS